jgi:hypothetical protein
VSEEELRETIVRAAIPLIGQRGIPTTAQIARAAGVDEADLLAVFEDPSAVFRASADAVNAVFLAALNPTAVLQELHAISLDQPLAARLADAIRALDSYRGRIVTFLASFEASGAGRPPGEDDRGLSTDACRTDVIRHGVARLLEPDREHLRLPVGALAGAFLGLYADCRVASDQDPSEWLADFFLHGAWVSEL